VVQPSGLPAKHHKFFGVEHDQWLDHKLANLEEHAGTILHRIVTGRVVLCVVDAVRFSRVMNEAQIEHLGHQDITLIEWLDTNLVDAKELVRWICAS